MKLLKLVPVAVLAVGVLTPSAYSSDRDDHDHDHGHHRDYHDDHHHWRHDHDGPRIHVGFGYYGGGPYYYHRPYYHRTVVVHEPVYVRGSSVEVDVQRELASRGYYGGAVDGDIGPQTRAAIRTYQVDKGLPVTGRIDGSLLRSLHLD